MAQAFKGLWNHLLHYGVYIGKKRYSYKIYFMEKFKIYFIEVVILIYNLVYNFVYNIYNK